MSGDMPLRRARTKREKHKTYHDSRRRFRALMEPTQSDPQSEDEDNVMQKKMKMEDKPEEGSMGHSSSDVAMGEGSVKPTPAEEEKGREEGGSNEKKKDKQSPESTADKKTEPSSSAETKKEDKGEKEENLSSDEGQPEFFWDVKTKLNEPPKRDLKGKEPARGRNVGEKQPMIIDSESESTSDDYDSERDFRAMVGPQWFKSDLPSAPACIPPVEITDDETEDDEEDKKEDKNSEEDDKDGKDGDGSSGGNKDGDAGGNEGGDKKAEDEPKDGGGPSDDKDKQDDGGQGDGNGKGEDDKKEDDDAADDEEKDDDDELDDDKKKPKGWGDNNENDPDGSADSPMEENEADGDAGAEDRMNENAGDPDFGMDGAKDPYDFVESEDYFEDTGYHSDPNPPFEYIARAVSDHILFESEDEEDDEMLRRDEVEETLQEKRLESEDEEDDEMLRRDEVEETLQEKRRAG